jgi:hypothetical protein
MTETKWEVDKGWEVTTQMVIKKCQKVMVT